MTTNMNTDFLLTYKEEDLLTSMRYKGEADEDVHDWKKLSLFMYRLNLFT